jgi:uncharacterized protein
MERPAGSYIGSALLLAVLGVAGACVQGNDDTGFDATAVLGGAEDVLEQSLDEVLVALDGLDVALAAWAEAPTDVTLQGDAQAAWTEVFEAWQVVEVMQLGPIGSSLTVAGGEDLRDEVYSWPTVNPCRVDQETVEQAWDEADFFTANLVNSYGLDALEQLLYGEEADTCPAQVGIDEDWAALGPDAVQQNRADFAVALAQQVRVDVQAMQPVELSYDSHTQGLNEILRALFYLDTVSKDLKLARPMGLDGCSTETCPETVEAGLSATSMLALQANLLGFRRLFFGGEGEGLDDILVALGRDDLVTDMTAALDAADASLDFGPLSTAVDEDPETVQAAYDAVKAVTDLLKGEVTTILALQIPDEAAGDAD